MADYDHSITKIGHTEHLFLTIFGLMTLCGQKLARRVD
jgi:hypothetical protein